MSATKVTVTCMGGPVHGRTLSVDARSRFVAVPFPAAFGFGEHRYEIIGSLAFYVETLG